jgi:hypothetical protein
MTLVNVLKETECTLPPLQYDKVIAYQFHLLVAILPVGIQSDSTKTPDTEIQSVLIGVFVAMSIRRLLTVQPKASSCSLGSSLSAAVAAAADVDAATASVDTSAALYASWTQE